MEIRNFRRKYDLELIPASNETIILGSLVWNPLLGKPRLEHKGMSNHIFNAIYDAGLIDKNQWSDLMEKIKQTQTVQASFAERTINIDSDHSLSMEHPQLERLQGEFEIQKIRKFSFQDISARIMSNLMRLSIDDLLDELKKENWESYDGKIRRLDMITELYYGNIQVIIENKYANELELALKNSGIAVNQKSAMGRDVEYTFKHQEVPFAMRLERVRHFNA
ncbi:MAG: hypothetical protein R6T91_03240 [Bacteroidales bacterium]